MSGILKELHYMFRTLRESVYVLAVKRPRCREPMSLELRPLRDDVYRPALFCYDVIFSERGA